jgi:F-type H+-transporting ATPase subunit epsilon
MAAATLHLQVVTPEAKIFDSTVEGVVLPGSEGEMGALPMHAALMTKLNPGELLIRLDGRTHSLAVGHGFVQINQTHVSVLTDTAVEPDKIDEAATQAAIQRAQDALRSKTLAGEELEATMAALARSLTHLEIKRRKRKV